MLNTSLTELLFQEAAITANQALANGVGLLVSRPEDDAILVLFDLSLVDKFTRGKDPNLDVIIGMLEMQSESDAGFNLWEVRKSAARPGYGPLLYEVAMTKRWLMSDRRSVTDSALGVWKKFYNRQDVKKVRLSDDVRNYQSDERDVESLNWAYTLSNPPNVNPLIIAGKRVIGKFPGSAEDLVAAADDFFNWMYK